MMAVREAQAVPAVVRVNRKASWVQSVSSPFVASTLAVAK
jgi:hypothetical protein